MKSKNMKFKMRIVLTVLVILFVFVVESAISPVSTTSQNEAAVAQLENSDLTYARTQAEFRFWKYSDVISWVVVGSSIVLIWKPVVLPLVLGEENE